MLLRTFKAWNAQVTIYVEYSPSSKCINKNSTLFIWAFVIGQKHLIGLNKVSNVIYVNVM
jgi:hypothetical protein